MVRSIHPRWDTDVMTGTYFFFEFGRAIGDMLELRRSSEPSEKPIRRCPGEGARKILDVWE